MSEIFLVRHGQASFGSDDYDRLSPLGEQQSVWLGEYFAERGLLFDRVVTGTLLRHRQTAEGIFRGMGKSMPVEQNAELNEYDFRRLVQAVVIEADIPTDPVEQKRFFYRRLKQAIQLWAEDKLPGSFPETWAEFQGRVRNALARIRVGGGRVLVVSSGGPMGAAMQQILDAPSHTAIELNLQIRNSSYCQIFYNEHAFRMMGFNAVPHLDRADRLHAITFA